MTIIDPQPQVGDPAEQSQEPAAQTPTTDPKTYDEAYVRQLRQEAAGYRTKLSSYEKAEEDRRQASLSETQKAQERADAAERALKDAQERNACLAIQYKAQQKGAVDADAVYALLDRSSFDASDDAALDKAIDDLLAAKTYLRAAQEEAEKAKTTAPKTTTISPPRNQQPSWAGRGNRL